MKLRGYYFITDHSLSRAGNTADVRAATAAGVQVIQYREKNLSSRELYEEALALKKLCSDSLFIVNDRLDLTLAVNADGLHIGQEDIPLATARALLGKDKLIGVTVSTPEEADAAEAGGADYLGVSPIFSTQTKADAGAPRGIGLIVAIKKTSKLPLVAIGGINLDNAPEVIAAGADMLCAISAVVASGDVSKAIRHFQELYP